MIIERFWYLIEHRFHRALTEYRKNWLYNWVGLVARHKCMMAACRRIAIKNPVKIREIKVKCERALRREREDRIRIFMKRSNAVWAL
jgi:hypothetical protein